MHGPPHGSTGAPRWVRGEPGFLAAVRAAGLSGPRGLGDRAIGEPRTDHRTSWVRLVNVGPYSAYVKTYEYPTRRDRLRGLFRTTFAAPSRARREWDALTWLLRAGLPGPRPLAVDEVRRLGLLHRAVLVTAAWPGENVETLLRSALPASERELLVAAVLRFVADLHARGFRDRNLDLRNLLARRTAHGSFEIAKIDSPRHRLVRPGARDDRLAREDRARLRDSFRAVGIDSLPDAP